MAKHGWKLVNSLKWAPQTCAVFPHIGSSSGAMFVDTGVEINSALRNPHIYISDVAVRELAELMGYVPNGAQKAAEAERDEAKVDLMLAEARIAALEDQLEGVKSTIRLVK